MNSVVQKYFASKRLHSSIPRLASVAFKHLAARKDAVIVAEEKPVGYGDSFDFDLPPRTVDWVIDGHFYTGQQIRCKKGDGGAFLKDPLETKIGDSGIRIASALKSPFQSRAPMP
jgi:hypothetical protein